MRCPGWAQPTAAWLSMMLGERIGGWRRRLSLQLEALGDYASESSTSARARDHEGSWLRPKGNLNRGELALLIVVATLPLAMMVPRIAAFPGVLDAGLSGGWLSAIGHHINQLLTLDEIPAGDRDRVLYLLFIPTGAMLIAFARLTLGLRVIGFRAILISMGFQQSGVIPSLILIAVVVAIVVSVRPTLVRIRLPYYARVSVIMSISVLVLLGALLVAPWVRSEVVWGLGFFPVLVLGLLAEGIAKTMDRDSGLTAMWRTGMTIGMSLLLAGIAQIPALRALSIQFPELVITQIVAVILIAEFLDLRLLQDWDARLSGAALPRLFTDRRALRIALVRSHRKSGVIGQLGAPSLGGYSRRSLRKVIAGLRGRGHTVKVIDGDMQLLTKLRDFLPAHPRTGQPGGIVLNLAHGIQGEIPAAHVPAMLEMAGVAYAGTTPRGHMIALDRVLTTGMLGRAGLHAPPQLVVSDHEGLPPRLELPCVVKPRYSPRYRLRVARDRRQLEEAVRIVCRRHHQDAVIEPYIAGRQIQAALIGNEPTQCLPLIELVPGREEPVCPAALDDELAERVRDAAVRGFAACEARDYALVDLRIAGDGVIWVLGVCELGALEPGGSFERAAEAAGHDYAALLDRIVMVARARYARVQRPTELDLVPGHDDEVVDGRALRVG